MQFLHFKRILRGNGLRRRRKGADLPFHFRQLIQNLFHFLLKELGCANRLLTAIPPVFFVYQLHDALQNFLRRHRITVLKREKDRWNASIRAFRRRRSRASQLEALLKSGNQISDRGKDPAFRIQAKTFNHFGAGQAAIHQLG